MPGRYLPGVLESHQLADQALDILHRSDLGVAGSAGIGVGRLSQELQIFLLDGGELGGNTHIHGKLANSIHSGLANQ